MNTPATAPSSQVLYRKWRPQSFSEVAGQDAVTDTLRNSVAQGSLAHAYLFCGPRGTGKTSLGRLLAKAANCAAPVSGEPCNTCDSCTAFNDGRAMDFVEQDAASHNSVDDIRQLRENVALTPMAGGRKVYLLDEVHMLSVPAQNALLKTLEEPPPHIIFVLATTEAHKVSPTIVSRCQRFDLKRIPTSAVADRLEHICREEGFHVGRDGLDEIARSATGSLRDAINALQQVVSHYGEAPSLEQVRETLGLSTDARSGQLARLALTGDLTGGLQLIADVSDDGGDIRQFTKQLVRYLRAMMMAKAGVDGQSRDLPDEMADELARVARETPRESLLVALQVFGRVDFRGETQSSLPLELALIDVVEQLATRPSDAPTAPKPPRQPVAANRAPAAAGEVKTDRISDGLATTSGPLVTPSVEEVSQHVTSEPERPELAHLSADALLERVRASLKETDKQLSALLNGSCEIKSADGEVVVIGFYHTFHLERIEQGSYGSILERAFANEIGRPVKVEYQHAPRERPESSRAKRSGHLVEAARELGARPVPPDA